MYGTTPRKQVSGSSEAQGKKDDSDLRQYPTANEWEKPWAGEKQPRVYPGGRRSSKESLKERYEEYKMIQARKAARAET